MSARYEWYQNDEKVVVSVFVKKADEKKCSVEIHPDRIVVTGDDGLNLALDLFANINHHQSGFKISAVKIEITLRKLIGHLWPWLIKTEETNVVTPPLVTVTSDSDKAVTSETSAKYPKIPRDHKNWDNVVKDLCNKEDIENDEFDGDSGFLKKLLKGLTPEQQKAGIKSFTESGGTVLNTNWEEVRDRKVEVRPPNGVEHRQYDR